MKGSGYKNILPYVPQTYRCMQVTKIDDIDLPAAVKVKNDLYHREDNKFKRQWYMIISNKDPLKWFRIIDSKEWGPLRLWRCTHALRQKAFRHGIPGNQLVIFAVYNYGIVFHWTMYVTPEMVNAWEAKRKERTNAHRIAINQWNFKRRIQISEPSKDMLMVVRTHKNSIRGALIDQISKIEGKPPSERQIQKNIKKAYYRDKEAGEFVEYYWTRIPVVVCTIYGVIRHIEIKVKVPKTNDQPANNVPNSLFP